jgi:hypothetical protein
MASFTARGVCVPTSFISPVSGGRLPEKSQSGFDPKLELVDMLIWGAG